ncbi:MAG: glycosyltransferase [Proteobacteria bacterium]|nr:glycosyltransferase [Pseudomonadota bacterium]
MPDTTTRPDIAVLMPVYNPGPELLPTVESIRSQGVPCRLFLVDDGSKKKADYEAILKGMDHKLIVLPQNKGITGAMNAGLAEILKGDFTYIARLDNGDMMLPDRLAVQTAYMKAHPEIDILGSWIELEDMNSGAKRILKHPVSPEAVAQAMWHNMAMTHPSLLIRTSFFRTHGPYSDLYDAAEDYELTRRALKRGSKIANDDKVLTRKIETSQSISWQKRRVQLLSRLRIQWHYRDLTKPACWIGMAKTLALSITPVSISAKIKNLMAARG